MFDLNHVVAVAASTFDHISNKLNEYPSGSFVTLEMYPSKPGLWQLETEVGFNQERGMQTLFLVLADGNKNIVALHVVEYIEFLYLFIRPTDCYHPLGLESCSVKDGQINATSHRGR